MLVLTDKVSSLATSQDIVQKALITMKTVVLFGGTGFIGTHLAQHLLKHNLAETIYLVDLNEPCDCPYTRLLNSGLRSNLPGAENVCAWASEMGSELLVFTSSISPYGPSDEKKTETSLPAPTTAYGSSKLAAEAIHKEWQGAGKGRKLLILRPGVVFGAGERGNVTRLVRSLVKGYFLYLGNRKTIKAAGYVKELCLVTMFCLEAIQRTDTTALLVNFTMDPPPTVEGMVNAILKTIGKTRAPFSVHPNLLLSLCYPLQVAARVFRIQLPIDQVRVRKLIRSNNVWPEQLKLLGYEYTYTLESAFLDWKQDRPEDFSG
jgi:nucleoside-diphosphate-sugar epimerase